MSDFLAGLEVRLADSFSIDVNEAADDFDPVPFSRRRLDACSLRTQFQEATAKLDGRNLRAPFSRRSVSAAPYLSPRPGQFSRRRPGCHAST